MMKRLFLGMPPSTEILNGLLKIQQGLGRIEPLADDAKSCRWLSERNLHVTLHFIGETEDEIVKPLLDKMQSLAVQASATEQVLDEWVFFPNPRGARIGGIGHFPAVGPLQNLWEKLGDALRSLDLPVEDRPFHPHVTLVRFRNPVEFGLPPPPQPLTYKVESLALYESHLAIHGSRYEMLGEFPLARPRGA